MINFLFWTVLPPGASKVDQTHKFDDFLNLTQLFPITPDRVFVERNDVNNVICNNFVSHDQLPKMHRFLTGAYKVDQKTIFSTRWPNFANFRDSWSENHVS